MTTEFPEVIVNVRKEKTIPVITGKGGRVAIIGAFKSNITTLQSFTNIDDAKTAFDDDASFDGYKCLKQILKKDGGAESVTVANYAVETTPGTWDKTLDNTKLGKCLDLLVEEKYDILFIAAELTDAQFTLVKAALEYAYSARKPVGLVAPVNRSDDAARKTTAEIFKDWGSYALITQALQLNGTNLTLLESSAYICGIMAAAKLDDTFTYKTLDGVTGVVTEYDFSPNCTKTDGNGQGLMKAGLMVFKVYDRVNKVVKVVNGDQPCGYNLYVCRTTNYVVQNLNLEEYLGLTSKSKNVNAIKSYVEGLRVELVNRLELLEDIKYRVEKTSPSCITIYIDSLAFAGVITKIQVEISIDVE